ncbi:Integral membrane protein OS=Streptomyces aurantiogriseus OX=66870 GN=GCM10010251_53590 PE=4 SV=1 [Streptomyces aurantiogriseus]
MNIRSLTRGDGVVIGAAVLLFIASFLDTFDGSGDDVPNAWDNLGLLMSMYVGGIIGAALIVVARALPQPRKVIGLDLGQLGVALTIVAAWTALWTIIDPLGAFTDAFDGADIGAGTGLILGLIGALLLAAGAVATPLVPALQAGLIPAPKPPQPQPYGAQPPAGYGYPGAQQQPSPFGGPQPGQPGQPGQQPFGGPQPGPAQPPAADFSPSSLRMVSISSRITVMGVLC